MVGYRTIVFNAVMAAIALLRQVAPDLVIPSDEEISKILEAIWAIVAIGGNIGLRFITKGPVGVKDPECK